MKTELIIGLIFFGCIALIVFFVTDSIWVNPVAKKGEILNLTFSPGKTSTGTGVATVPNGSGGISVSPVVTVSSTNDEWIVTVRSEGKIFHAKASEERFYTLKTGETIAFTCYYGKLSGSLVQANIK